MGYRLNEEKLKRLFFLCLIFIIFLLVITSFDFEAVTSANNLATGNQNVNVSSYQKFENLNYNNLSNAEKEYISSKYFGNINFTENGVEIYEEGSSYGKPNKIITSTWPLAEIGSFIPNADYGELDRIEYSENWISIYIKDAKKSNVKDYLKLLEEYNFKERFENYAST